MQPPDGTSHMRHLQALKPTNFKSKDPPITNSQTHQSLIHIPTRCTFPNVPIAFGGWTNCKSKTPAIANAQIHQLQMHKSANRQFKNPPIDNAQIHQLQMHEFTSC